MVDLPGTLIFSQYYLSKLFSSDNILKYEDSRDIESFDVDKLKKCRLVFLGRWQLPKFANKSLDVFINIYSFQEMKVEQINNYFNLIEEKVRNLFYNKQSIVSVNDWDNVKITKDTYPIRKNWKEIYFRKSKLAQYMFESLYKIN